MYVLFVVRCRATGKNGVSSCTSLPRTQDRAGSGAGEQPGPTGLSGASGIILKPCSPWAEPILVYHTGLHPAQLQH